MGKRRYHALIHRAPWVCLLFWGVAAGSEAPPHFILKWGTFGTANGRFQNPTDIAVDSQGNVYVADAGNSRIQKFDGTGGFIAKFGRPGTGSGEFFSLHAITIGSDDFVYTLESSGYPGYDRIQRFSTMGTFDSFLSLSPFPFGLDLDAGGYIYISSLYPAEILKFDSHGALVATWSLDTTGDGRFVSPDRLCIDKMGGVLYVTDVFNNEILGFDTTGVYKSKWEIPGEDVGVDTQGDIYVVHGDHIEKYTRDGVLVTSWGGQGTGNGEFQGACAIAVDSHGDIYVLDRENQRVQKFGHKVSVEARSWSEIKELYR